MIIFETDRLIVRRFTFADAGNFFKVNGDENVVRYIRAALNKEDSDKFLQTTIEFYSTHPNLGRWAVTEKATGNFAGSFALIPLPFEDEKDRMQIGYALIPSAWGKGYATELTARGKDFYFEHHPYDELHAITSLPNFASQKVLIKCGFRENGMKDDKGETLQRFIMNRSL